MVGRSRASLLPGQELTFGPSAAPVPRCHDGVMGDRGLCPHGLERASCLICRTLAPTGPRPARLDQDRVAERRRSFGVGRTLAVLPVVAVAGLLVVSWVAAFAWALIRLVELVAVALVAGSVGWRLGVRHGRRHPT